MDAFCQQVVLQKEANLWALGRITKLKQQKEKVEVIMNGKESISGFVNRQVVPSMLAISRQPRAMLSLAVCRKLLWTVLVLGSFSSLLAAPFVDSSFNPNVNGVVLATAIQSNGKIWIGGQFTTVGGTARSNLALLNSDGSLDTAFSLTPDGFVAAIYVQPDGRVLIGGDFYDISGTSRDFFARLEDLGDGFVVDTDMGNTGFNNRVFAVGVQSYGSWFRPIVGGLFNNSGHTGIARVGDDGSIDTTFVANPLGAVYALAVKSDNTIYAGGSFTYASRTNAAWLNANGYVITGPEFTANPNGPVLAIAKPTSGTTLLGGAFTSVHGSAVTNVAKVDDYGVVLDNVGNPGPNGSVLAIKVDGNGNYLIGGSFSSIGNTSRTNIALLTTTGAVDTGFTGVSMVGYGEIRTLSLFSNGDILIGGSFTSVNGLTRNRVAKLNLTD